MRASGTFLPRLEALEGRWTPATFNWFGFGSTIQIVQTQGAVGALTITDNVSSLTFFDSGDGSSATVNLAGFNDLTVTLLGTDALPVTYDLTGFRPGNLTLNVNNALPRTLVFDGGPIAGNLSMTAGSGGLTVVETISIVVGGNFFFNGGVGPDTLAFNGTGGTTVGGNLFLSRANVLSTAPGDVIGGSLIFNDFGGGHPDIVHLASTVVGGDINYFGGNRGDFVALAGTSPVVGRNVSVNFSNQLPGDSSALIQVAGPGFSSVIGGVVNVQGGNLGTEAVVLSGVVGGSISINLAGGTNTVIANGLLAGSSFVYFGGFGVDTIVYAPIPGSVRASFVASLGAGNDVVLFLGGVSNPAFASVDFGAGFDAVGGLLNFPFSFRNLP